MLACRAMALFTAALIVLAPSAGTTPRKDRPVPVALRWAEGQPGCTYSRDSDGKYRYALWTTDYGVILAVDSQELQLVHKRVIRVFGVQLTVRFRGTGALEVNPGRATLEFLKHANVIQPSLYPKEFAKKVKADLNDVEKDTRREIKKHPERRAKREQFIEEYRKETTELVDFITQHALRPVQLDADQTQADGWLFFSTQNKWIGEWKRPEEFVLRLPMADRMLEFPFALPPQQGDLILRKRSP
jgi:hypothetical protein